jgi:hypothetical protein
MREIHALLREIHALWRGAEKWLRAFAGILREKPVGIGAAKENLEIRLTVCAILAKSAACPGQKN